MVGLTIGVAATSILFPKTRHGATVGAGIGAGVASTEESTAEKVAGAAAGAAVTGAIVCAATAAESAIGAIAAGTGAVAVTATSGGAASVVALATAPLVVPVAAVGCLVVGAEEEPTTSGYTFDCWKQVVHDMSPEPSSGRLLREIVADPRVKQVISGGDDSHFPEIILENIWGEKFRIEYVLLPADQLAAHAVLLSP